MQPQRPNDSRSGDSRTVEQAKLILAGERPKNPIAEILPFMGPAFIASVAYIDPGNFATNISAGAQFGYTLLWVVFASNLMAMVVQGLSAKLGIATGRNLAEHSRDHFPKPVVRALWVIMELVAMATDLAEFLGATLGFNLLFGFPLWLGAIMTIIATFVILGLERYGFRQLEATIGTLVVVIAVCYLVETVLDRPDWGQLAFYAVVPHFAGSSSILLATGILGATVMPHAIYLHSALTQDRIVVKEPKLQKRLLRYEVIELVIAMGLAGVINAAMLIMSASTFNRSGMQGVATIQQAYQTLEPLLGRLASVVFGVSLLASGLSSTTVGTMAGQIIMQGFLNWSIPVWVRRLVTIIPSLIVILIGLDPTRTLVISQVLLSFGLPFAVLPLVFFTSRKDVMGELVNSKPTIVVGGIIAAVILVLNVYLILSTFSGGG